MQTPRDENRIPVLMAVLNTDGITPVAICSDKITAHYLCGENGTTGTDYGPDNAPRDENRIPVAMAVSSVDGITPVVLYANIDKELLVKST